MIVSDPVQIEQLLKNILCSGKTVIACVGSPLRSDDRAGLVIYSKIKESISRYIFIVECEYGLENCLSEIIEQNPDNLLIIDAVYNESLDPGTIVLTDSGSIRDKISTATTHAIPLNTVLELIRKSTRLENVFLLGVRAENLNIGVDISPKVRKSIEILTGILKKAIISCRK